MEVEEGAQQPLRFRFPQWNGNWVLQKLKFKLLMGTSFKGFHNQEQKN